LCLLLVVWWTAASAPTALAQAFITTPYDRIPNFGANPTIVSAHSGAWSSTGTWSPARVPVAGDVVSIAWGRPSPTMSPLPLRSIRARSSARNRWVAHSRGWLPQNPPGPPLVRGGKGREPAGFHPPLAKGGFGGVLRHHTASVRHPTVSRSRTALISSSGPM